MKTLIIYSSLTGNTKLVGEKIYEILPNEKEIISIEKISFVDINSFDRIIFGFWVDKGTADKRTREIIKILK